MVTTIAKKKRGIFRIQLTGKAKNELVELADRLGMSQSTLMRRLVEWFCTQNESTRAFVLDFIPESIAADVAKLVMKNLD